MIAQVARVEQVLKDCQHGFYLGQIQDVEAVDYCKLHGLIEMYSQGNLFKDMMLPKARVTDKGFAWAEENDVDL